MYCVSPRIVVGLLLVVSSYPQFVHADTPNESPVLPTGEGTVSIKASIIDLGANVFDRRRSAFLEIWQLGPTALPLVRKAKSSDIREVAQAAGALEALLLLDVSRQDLGLDAVDLLLEPTPGRIVLLCKRRKWELAQHLIDASPSLVVAFKRPQGRVYVLQIVEAALAQGAPRLSWPIVRLAAAPYNSERDGSNLSLWLAEKLDLELNTGKEDLDVESRALRLFYRGEVESALALNVSDSLRRKIITRSGQWSRFNEDRNRSAVLGDGESTAHRAASAVLFEFSGSREKAEQIWNQILGPEKEVDEDAKDRMRNYAVAELHAASNDDGSQLALALILSGRVKAVEQYLAETNPQAAFGFYIASGEYVEAFKLLGLEPEFSNFDLWLVQRTAMLKTESAQSFRGRTHFSETLQVCSLLVRLGFPNKARQLLDVVVRFARTNQRLWTGTGSIIRHMGRGESRGMCLDVVAAHIRTMDFDKKHVFLESLFPEFKLSANVLAQSAPVYDNTGQRVSEVPLLERLHTWDTRYFEAQFGDGAVAEWLTRANRKILFGETALDRPRMIVAQLSELSELALGCGLTDLAHQFAEVDLREIGAVGNMVQTQWIDAARMHTDEGDPAKAAETLKKFRTTPNSGNNQLALVDEIRALVLAGDHQQALHLERSRLLRLLAVSRYSQGASYSQAVTLFADRDDFIAAREYAELAFALTDFSSTDVYWAASDLANILQEFDEFRSAADVLRAPLVEALQPRSAVLNYFVARGYYSLLRDSGQKERLYRAIAAITRGDIPNAARHIKIGQQLQPQDIEMVVQCYPRLVDAGGASVAEAMFDSIEASMLQQIQQWPKDATALNNLSWMYSQCDRNLDQALELAQKATALAPRSAVYLDTLAEVHFRSGRVAKAIDLMHECVRLDPREKHYQSNLVRFAPQ